MKPVRLGLAMVAASLVALIGCNLTQADRRKADSKAMVIGGSGAGLVASRQCALVFRIVTRPSDDEALGSVLWGAADEQIVPEEARKALEANGLRLGILTGDLPKELRAVIDAPPPKRVDPMTVVLPDGESTVVELASAVSRSLEIRKPGAEAASRSYSDLHGLFRLTTRLGEPGVVGLRIVPELRHGPIRRNWAPAPSVGALSPMQFVIRDGQQEETLSDLKAEVALRPGQYAVVSGRPGARGGLGEFFFSGVEPNSDRGTRTVLILSASRSDPDSTAGPIAAPPRLEPAEAPEDAANPKPR